MRVELTLRPEPRSSFAVCPLTLLAPCCTACSDIFAICVCDVEWLQRRDRGKVRGQVSKWILLVQYPCKLQVDAILQLNILNGFMLLLLYPFYPRTWFLYTFYQFHYVFLLFSV